MYLSPLCGRRNSQADPVLGGVTNSTLPCLAGSSMGGSRGAPQQSDSEQNISAKRERNSALQNGSGFIMVMRFLSPFGRCE